MTTLRSRSAFTGGGTRTDVARRTGTTRPGPFGWAMSSAPADDTSGSISTERGASGHAVGNGPVWRGSRSSDASTPCGASGSPPCADRQSAPAAIVGASGPEGPLLETLGGLRRDELVDERVKRDPGARSRLRQEGLVQLLRQGSLF